MNCNICGFKLSVLRDFGCWSFYCMKCNEFRSESFPNSVNPDNVKSKRTCEECKRDFSALLPKQYYCYECLDDVNDEPQVIFDIDIDEDTTDAEYDEFFRQLEHWVKGGN